MRATNKPASRRRRKKILERAKGFWGMRGNTLRQAKDHVVKALQYSYRDRRTKKREFRRLWIARINAAARLNGTTYSKLISALKKKQVEINRKMLAELAVNNPSAFSDIVKFAFS